MNIEFLRIGEALARREEVTRHGVRDFWGVFTRY